MALKKSQNTVGKNVEMQNGELGDHGVAERAAALVAVKRIKELEKCLRAIAELARTTPRPTGCHALCRALIDIEGIARATIVEPVYAESASVAAK